MRFAASIAAIVVTLAGCGGGARNNGDAGTDTGPDTGPAEEMCDGVDDNGDGVVDEGCACARGWAQELQGWEAVNLSYIWAAPDGTAFASGYEEDLQKRLFYYDGSQWAHVRWDHPDAWAMWGRAPDDVYLAAGSAGVFRFDGADWENVYDAASTGDYIRAVWVAFDGDVFAGGADGVLLHHDGVSWERWAFGDYYVWFGLWGISSTEVYAVGIDWTETLFDENDGVIVRYDGSAWEEVYREYLGEYGSLFAASGTSMSDVYFIGRENSPSAPRTFVIHFDGVEWERIADAHQSYSGVWAIDATNVLFVDMHGQVEGYDGTAWQELYPGPAPQLWGVHGSLPTNVFAVGQEGTILHRCGADW